MLIGIRWRVYGVGLRTSSVHVTMIGVIQADRDASEYHPNHCHMDRGGSNTHPIHAPADSCQHPVLRYCIDTEALVFMFKGIIHV